MKFLILNKYKVMQHACLNNLGALVVTEALAAGKPVICLDIGGPGYQVDNSVGIKIKVNNRRQVVKDLSRAMEILYKNKSLYQKMSISARVKVLRELTWNSKIKVINQYYNTLETSLKNY